MRAVSAVAVHLRVLGLADGEHTDAATLKAAFHERARCCHPDLHSEPAKAAAEAEFKRVLEAYQFLKASAAKAA
jgi:curved DNA-binding protein CbpA